MDGWKWLYRQGMMEEFERVFIGVKDKHKWLSLSTRELLASGEVQFLSIVAHSILHRDWSYD